METTKLREKEEVVKRGIEITVDLRKAHDFSTGKDLELAEMSGRG